jgi:DNA-directed RNA polymerase specialized sigma24 family protein
LLRLLVSAEFVSFRRHPLVWLTQVTRNLCLNRIRDQDRRKELLSEFAVEPSAAPSREAVILLR